MKKLLLIIVILFTGIINVKATSTEEELQDIINIFPNSYNLIIENRVNLGTNNGLLDYYFYEKTQRLLKEANWDYDKLYYRFSVARNDNNYNIKLYNLEECYVSEGEYYTNCDKEVVVEKNINLNISYISDTSNDNLISNILSSLNQKEEYSDFSMYYTENILSTPKKVNEIALWSGFDIIYNIYKGSGCPNNDSTIEIPLNTGKTFFIKNGILYDVKDIDYIDVTFYGNGSYFNNYFPKLSLSSYDDIEEYIDDALEDFPTKAHLSNYEVINQADGKRYKKTTEDDIDYYEVLINDLDNDVEWTMYFSGKLKVKETNIKGDLNNNGRIDLKDIILLIRLYLGLDN